MIKRIFTRLAIVVLLGIPLFVLKACSIIQGPIPPAENGTQWVWFVYWFISFIIIFSWASKDTYPSTSNYKKPESVDGKIILKRFLFRLTIVVILSVILYVVKAHDNPEALTSPPWVIFADGVMPEGWGILIVVALCILFCGLKKKYRPPVYYSSPSMPEESPYENHEYYCLEYDAENNSVSSEEKVLGSNELVSPDDDNQSTNDDQ